MQVRERKLSGIAIVEVEGRLTLTEQPGMLRDAVARLIAQGEKAIVLNLKALRFVDSACIGELVFCYLAAEAAGGCVKIAAMPPHVGELLRMTHLHTLFERYDSEATAIASFSPATA